MNTALHVLSTGLGLFQLSNIQLITTNMKELLKLHSVEGKGTSYTQASPQAIHKLHTLLYSSLFCIHVFHNSLIQLGQIYCHLAMKFYLQKV